MERLRDGCWLRRSCNSRRLVHGRCQRFLLAAHVPRRSRPVPENESPPLARALLWRGRGAGARAGMGVTLALEGFHHHRGGRRGLPARRRAPEASHLGFECYRDILPTDKNQA